MRGAGGEHRPQAARRARPPATRRREPLQLRARPRDRGGRLPVLPLRPHRRRLRHRRCARPRGRRATTPTPSSSSGRCSTPARGWSGISRMYENWHWASDVVMGAAIGSFAGWKTVRYAHSHPGNFGGPLAALRLPPARPARAGTPRRGAAALSPHAPRAPLPALPGARHAVRRPDQRPGLEGRQPRIPGRGNCAARSLLPEPSPFLRPPGYRMSRSVAEPRPAEAWPALPLEGWRGHRAPPSTSGRRWWGRSASPARRW